MVTRLVGVLAVLLAWGCGGESDGMSNASVQVNVVNAGDGAAAVRRNPTPHGAPAAAVAAVTALSLESLQYYIQSVQFCEDVTTSGTGFSGTSGCLEVYSNNTSVEEYNTYTITEALADTTPGHFIDFMTSEGRAELAAPHMLPESAARIYKYGLINYMRPIKMKATFLDTDANPLFYTRTPEAADIETRPIDEGREAEGVHFQTTPDTGPAELMTYMLNNGGVVYPFMKPFEITDADIADGRNLIVDFAFNPDAFASAHRQGGGCDPSSRSDVSAVGCVFFSLPYARLSPIPRKDGESTRKEVYLVDDYDTTSGQETKLRIELYYNDADADKGIQGVDMTALPQPGATSLSQNVIGAQSASETAGSVTFIGYNPMTSENDATTLSGLTRRADGTVSLFCFFNGGPCSVADGSELMRNVTYVGDEAVVAAP